MSLWIIFLAAQLSSPTQLPSHAMQPANTWTAAKQVSLQQLLLAQGYEAVPLIRVKKGLGFGYLVKAKIAKTEFTMLLDTAVILSSIDTNFASELNLVTSREHTDLVDCPTLKLDRFEIAKHLGRLPLSVKSAYSEKYYDELGMDYQVKGVLGAHHMDTLSAVIDFEHEKLYLLTPLKAIFPKLEGNWKPNIDAGKFTVLTWYQSDNPQLAYETTIEFNKQRLIMTRDNITKYYNIVYMAYGAEGLLLLRETVNLDPKTQYDAFARVRFEGRELVINFVSDAKYGIPTDFTAVAGSGRTLLRLQRAP